MQGNSSVIATIIVGTIIVGAAAYGIYTTNSELSALSEQNTSARTSTTHKSRFNLVTSVGDSGTGIGGVLTALILVSVMLMLLPVPQVASSAATSNAPLWAFDGAFVTYGYSFYYNGNAVSIKVTDTLSHVNASTGVYSYSITCSGTYCNVIPSGQTTGNASFDNPNMPAVSISVLAALNQGQSEGQVTGTVIANTTVTVPAGKFKADMVTSSQGTVWIDTKSGLYVKMLVTTLSGESGVTGPATIELENTNIPTTSSGGLTTLVLGITLVGVTAVVLVVVVYLALKRSRKGPEMQPAPGETGQGGTVPPVAPSPS